MLYIYLIHLALQNPLHRESINILHMAQSIRSTALKWSPPLLGVCSLYILSYPIYLRLSPRSGPSVVFLAIFLLIETQRFATATYVDNVKRGLEWDNSWHDLSMVFCMSLFHLGGMLFEWLYLCPTLNDMIFSQTDRQSIQTTDTCAKISWIFILFVVCVRTIYEICIVYVPKLDS